MERTLFLSGYLAIMACGNMAADFTAKNAIDGDISSICIPFSDMKPRLNSDNLNCGKMSGIIVP